MIKTILCTDQIGTDLQEALEEYRRQGMTKVGNDNTKSGQQQQQKGGKQQQGNSVEDTTSQTIVL